MHDNASLMLEAVANSIEAGAEEIAVSVSIEGSEVAIRVEDDGKAPIASDPFQDGSTTKGEGHGHGLHIIKERSGGNCSLARGDGCTVLYFRVEDDGSFDDLYPALLPLMTMATGISVAINRNGEKIALTRQLLLDRDAVPDRAEGIRNFKTLIRSLAEGDIYG